MWNSQLFSHAVLFVEPEGGTVQAAVQARGEAEEGVGPSAGLHCWPDGEILGPPEQVLGTHQACWDRRVSAEIPA